ncbi:protein DpdD [Nonomuraea sp. NPDC049625]|uniref:protein DpdD n=1 Tax=Nonomuraea sp. NPDC049625 TaxID=3155775 RepID=UPI003438B722
MTDMTQSDPRLELLLTRFFGEGNDVVLWPGVAEEYKRLARSGDASCIQLPRYVRRNDDFSMYVIAESSAHANQVGELISAFVGRTYSTNGEVLPASLDPQDPIDAAVLDFAWPHGTFIIRTTSHKGHRQNLRTALQLMHLTVNARPLRSWHVARPLGRLLAEFDGVLAAGGAASSKAVLDLIAAQGGITATNLAHLRIKRLDRLGQSEEMLSLEGLANVLRQDPPVPVKEAVLNAVHSAVVAEPLQQNDVSLALTRLQSISLPLPVHEDIGTYGTEAAVVAMLAAVGRRDSSALMQMRYVLQQSDRLAELPTSLSRHIELLVGEDAGYTTGDDDSANPSPSVAASTETRADVNASLPSQASALSSAFTSWTDLLRGLAEDPPGAAKAMSDDVWKTWPSVAETDAELASVLGTFDDQAWEGAWKVVGDLIDSLGYGESAPQTVRAFITSALAFDRFSVGDLVILQALVEIYLRSAPPAAAYRELLEELRSSCAQWVSPETAVIALDFADRLVLSACPDPDMRHALANALLWPLRQHQRRLDRSTLLFAQQLAHELGTEVEWEEYEAAGNESPLSALSGKSILLYSLDEAVLSRVSNELQRIIPDIKVSTAHDKVGHPSLKKKAQNANAVALATRCATHAATGFITDNAKKAKVTYADGAGSASLLRAAMVALNTLGSLPN